MTRARVFVAESQPASSVPVNVDAYMQTSAANFFFLSHAWLSTHLFFTIRKDLVVEVNLSRTTLFSPFELVGFFFIDRLTWIIKLPVFVACDKIIVAC